MRKTARGIFFFGFVYLLCFFLFCPELCTDAVRDALSLSVRGLIPSLFPFLVLSVLFVSSGGCRKAGAFLCRATNDALRLGANGTGAYLLGLFAGFPTGATAVFDCYRDGTMSKGEAQILCGICNQTGPAFLIGFIGGFLFHDLRFGLMLCLCQLLSGLMLLLVTRRKRASLPIGTGASIKAARGGICAVFADAVVKGTQNMLIICGFYVFFSVLLRVAAVTLAGFFGADTILIALFSGFLEITSGSVAAAALPYGKPLAALVCGWAGLCVHFQVAAFAPRDLSLKPYFCAKAAGAVLTCGFYCFFDFLLRVVPTEVFPFKTVLLAVGCGAFLLLLLGGLRRSGAK